MRAARHPLVPLQAGGGRQLHTSGGIKIAHSLTAWNASFYLANKAIMWSCQVSTGDEGVITPLFGARGAQDGAGKAFWGQPAHRLTLD